MTESIRMNIESRLKEKGYKNILHNDLNEVALEYESDSIEHYNMLSNEFNYEEIRVSNNFMIK